MPSSPRDGPGFIFTAWAEQQSVEPGLALGHVRHMSMGSKVESAGHSVALV